MTTDRYSDLLDSDAVVISGTGSPIPSAMSATKDVVVFEQDNKTFLRILATPFIVNSQDITPAIIRRMLPAEYQIAPPMIVYNDEQHAVPSDG